MVASGTFARISGFTEILFVVAVDDGDAWLKDDFGNRMTKRVDDLSAVPYADGKAYFAACARVHALDDDAQAKVEHRGELVRKVA